MSDWLREIRYSVRTLRRERALSITLVTTLALCIGANGVMFSLNRALSRDVLPFEGPERLIRLSETVQRDRLENRAFSFPDFDDLRRQSGSLSSVAAFYEAAVILGANGDRESERLRAERVSDRYFATLASQPATGRWLEGETESDTAMIGEALAERLFGNPTHAIDQSIRLDDHPYQVVGVMPRNFRGASDRAELWLPLATADSQALSRRNSRFLSGIGRLTPSASLDTARAELSTLFARLESEHPRTNQGYGATAERLDEAMLGPIRSMARALFACVGIVMLVACLNLANLLICRAVARRHEDAVRLALGAGRWRLARNAAAEIGIVALAGSLLGWVIALWGLETLQWVLPMAVPSFVHFRIDLETLAFAFAAALVAGLILTVITVIGVAARRRLSVRLGPRSATSDRPTQRLRASLVVGQVALALALAVGAGLLARSLHTLSAVDLGFDQRNLTFLRFDQPDERSTEARMQLVRDAGEALRALAGVEAVTFASDLPLDGEDSATVIAAEGQQPEPDAPYGGGVRVYRHRVDETFFRTLGVPFHQGRDFDAAEIGRDARVAVISKRLAQRLWPGESAVGKRIRGGAPTGSADEADWYAIIGVADEVRYRTLIDRPGTPLDPDLYLPIEGARASNLAVAIRAAADRPLSARAVSTAFHAIDPDAPLYGFTTAQAMVSSRTGRARFSAALMSAFATMALLLCCIGVHGTVAYSVAQRTREIGVRLAIGATRGGVTRLVLADGMKLVMLGSALGLVAALLVRRLVQSQLVGAGAFDAISFLVATLAVLVSAAIASALPAQRASRLDPVTVLRNE